MSGAEQGSNSQDNLDELLPLFKAYRAASNLPEIPDAEFPAYVNRLRQNSPQVLDGYIADWRRTYPGVLKDAGNQIEEVVGIKLPEM